MAGKKKNPLLMKIDKNFVPAPQEEGDEFFPNGIFVFNITKMVQFIKENEKDIDLERIDVKAYRNSMSRLNESHLDSVDISKPIILAEISPGRYNVIDGHHRLEKAYRIGRENIWAYKLKAKQHLQFLTSSKAYHAYIEYWNSKVIDFFPNASV